MDNGKVELEVDTSCQLPDAWIVDLSLRDNAKAGAADAGPWGAEVRSVENVEELATNLEAASFAKGELLEERRIDQRVNPLPHADVEAVGLSCISEPLLISRRG